MNKNWHGLLEVLEVKHIRNNQVIWQNFNLHNILHTQGEEFILKALFSNLITKPTYYYFGLDNRDNILLDDTLLSLNGEPQVHNYSRQAANSTDDWTFALIDGSMQARSLILTFGAYGGSWGPIRNLFLTTQIQEDPEEDGYLISSIYLGNSSITVTSGDSISLRMAVKLRNCIT